MLKDLFWPLLSTYQVIRPGLENTHSFLKALGEPQLKMPPVIHIAGTNGKGSTSATIAALLAASGYTSHVYTSPHLVYWNERIRVAGNLISDKLYQSFAERCMAVEQDSGIALSHFEALTCLAFLAFSENSADASIIEVGIGGRLDATNVIEAPLLTVITSISMDHTEFLGNTIAEIAGEKAGIMKTGSICVSAPQSREAAEVLIARAHQVGAPLFLGGRDWFYKISADQLELTVNFADGSTQRENYPLPKLVGEHQLENTAVALVSMVILGNHFTTEHQQRCDGISATRWPGRLQRMTPNNLRPDFPKFAEVWLDGAHNNAGALSLGNWLRNQAQLPLFIMAGCSRGRSLSAFIDDLNPGAVKHLIVVQGTSDGTKLSESSELNSPSLVGYKSSRINTTLELPDLLKNSKTEGARLLVCGSLHLVGDFLRSFSVEY
jgi:dihydrofolate synthase / folylpolyglutamate synthase